MLDIIGKKKWYFLISLLVIIPGVISMLIWGLRLSIDFTGGTRTILLYPTKVDKQIEDFTRVGFEDSKVEIVTMQASGERLIVRTKEIDEKKNKELMSNILRKVENVRQEEFETIGPTIGNETTGNALKALLVAFVLIVLYIAWSFRKVPKPTSSWRFGICAIVAVIHDVLITVGVFSLLGHFYNVEIDSLFVTAILTVIGFSVHDTIVVFDRIRENLRHSIGLPFAQVVNNSILQTLIRSLNTSITTVLVLITLLLFGGPSLQWFLVALIVGIASGTYSSIFNASALLVVWDELDTRRKRRNV